MNNSINPAALSTDLGGKWYGSYGTAPCPICQPERRKDQNALGVNVKDSRLLLNCKKSGCDFRDILAAIGILDGSHQVNCDWEKECEKARADRAAQAERSKRRARLTWGNGQAIANTHGEAYFRRRGITCALPDTLRWFPNILHIPSKSECGAIIANVTTGGIHRTFFTKQGARLSKDAKMMLGPCSGGAVRLSSDGGPLVVCEGIETGLSLMSGLLSGPASVWACLSTNGLSGVVLPTGASHLMIAMDGDEAGRAAGNKLAQRASALGWQVSMLQAPDQSDWNDVLQNGGAS